ncbi:MAG: isochorismatase family protein [Pseudomonadota bacterium]|nr:isochorismatase family protein [Pseudomonadota bacterium]
MNTADANSGALVLVDFQARLMPAIRNADAAVATAVLLARAARLLGIPVLGTEQNPAGLGPNVDPVKAECDRTLQKMHFDACADGLLEALQDARGSYAQVVIAGCEAHVCLLQTALGLLRAGLQVMVVENASASRCARDHTAALRRLSQAGASIVTHEMVIFEWLHDCKHPRFKDVLDLVKSAG